jgi:hypothetical protein
MGVAAVPGLRSGQRGRTGLRLNEILHSSPQNTGSITLGSNAGLRFYVSSDILGRGMRLM